MFKETLEQLDLFQEEIYKFDKVNQVLFFIYKENSKVYFSCPISFNEKTGKKENLEKLLNCLAMTQRNDHFTGVSLFYPSNKDIKNGIVNIHVSTEFEKIKDLYQEMNKFNY